MIKAAEALKHLQSDVAEVKAAAEDAILIGNRRIAEELAKVPKATIARGPKKQFSAQGRSVNGRAATGIKPTSRHRLGKLAQQSPGELKATAENCARRARTRRSRRSCWRSHKATRRRRGPNASASLHADRWHCRK